MSASSSADHPLPMATILHMITIKLSSTNYLLWKNQILPLLAYQNLDSHVNGTSLAPSSTITVAGKKSANPDHTAWLDADKRAILLINSSLTEEAFAEVLNLTTAREIWLSLEQAYSNSSVERRQHLQDQLRQLSKGEESYLEELRQLTSSVSEIFNYHLRRKLYSFLEELRQSSSKPPSMSDQAMDEVHASYQNTLDEFLRRPKTYDGIECDATRCLKVEPICLRDLIEIHKRKFRNRLLLQLEDLPEAESRPPLRLLFEEKRKFKSKEKYGTVASKQLPPLPGQEIREDVIAPT